jgi:hypothetical protein
LGGEGLQVRARAGESGLGRPNRHGASCLRLSADFSFARSYKRSEQDSRSRSAAQLLISLVMPLCICNHMHTNLPVVSANESDLKLEVSWGSESSIKLTIGRAYGAYRRQLHNPLPIPGLSISSSGDNSTPPNIALTSSFSVTRHIRLAITARSQSASVWATTQSFGSKQAANLLISNRRLARGLLLQSRAPCLRLFLLP